MDSQKGLIAEFVCLTALFIICAIAAILGEDGAKTGVPAGHAQSLAAAMEGPASAAKNEEVLTDSEEDYIHWVDFKVTAKALKDAYTYDITTYGQEVHLDWIELLAYLGARYGGDFKSYKSSDMEALAGKLTDEGLSMEELTKDMQYYSYYLEAYGAVLGGMVGEFEKEEEGTWRTVYGLKAYSPIAKTFPYSDYDDFGVSRSYGYERKHLGHDMMGQVGTPIIAVESGYVYALGWNQYGGWRIGINSFDGKRYYYYAHLRQNRPYAMDLEVGDVVQAGDVIGYMGRTGYSTTENVNNIKVNHLHFGMQLIFDESQREGNNEIWIDVYPIVQFLTANRSEVQRDDATKEWSRVEQIRDPAAEEYQENDGAP